MSLSPQPQTKTATQPAVKAAPDFIVVAKKADDLILTKAEQNPVYKFIFEGDINKEQRIAACKSSLLEGLQSGKATSEDMDARRAHLAEMNAAIQVLRKQLGLDAAKEITSSESANFQRILEVTSTDVGKFQDQLAPLTKLAELFAKFGADGNIIEKINTAKEQKRLRDQRKAAWQDSHDATVAALQSAIRDIRAEIQAEEDKLAAAWIGKGKIQAAIANGQADLQQRQEQLTAAQAETFVETAQPNEGEENVTIDEEILQLQNIGGEPFKNAVVDLRDHTEGTLAKISTNFDEAIRGLTNSRESFIQMDRNASEAILALSVLQVAVQEAEAESRKIAEEAVADDGKTGAMADLDRMEREQRNDQILTYTAALTSFVKEVAMAIGSLRKGQSVIKNVLRMNALALESANTHKITGIANTSDAVTITIGSIIEVCNRAASRALADGLSQIHETTESASQRLIGGTYETIAMQNQQLGEFVDSLAHLKEMQLQISANTVDELKKQYDLVQQMAKETAELGDATQDTERAAFNARAGVVPNGAAKVEQPPAEPVRRFGGMRMPH